MSANSSLEKDKTQSPENVCQSTAEVVAAETSNSSEGSREAQAAITDRREVPHKAAAAQNNHGEAVSNTLLPSPQVSVPPSHPPIGSGQTSVAPIQVCSTSTASLPKGQTTPPILMAVGPTPPRTPAPKSATVMVRPPQTASVPLPATFQIPPGMVLVRSDSGQLMLVSQQALAQAQKAVSNTSLVQPSTAPAVRKPASAPVIRVCLPVSAPKPTYATGATPQRPALSTGPSMQRPSAPVGKVSYRPTTAAVGTSAPRPSCPTGIITQRPTCATGTITQRPGSVMGAIIQRPGSAMGVGLQSPSSVRGPNPENLSSTVGTTHPLISCTTGATIVKAKDVIPVSRPAGLAPRLLPVNVPTKPKATPPDTPNSKTMENVKKCKNFLVTLMKLASSSSHSSDMGMNVRNLVKSLLDGKLEPEEFTDKLYKELKSSPQPYLVTFLKRSLPAVRQLTPDSELFIRQCEQPGAQASSSTQPSPSPSSSLRTPQPQPAMPTSQKLVVQPQQVVTTKKPMVLQPIVLGRGVSKLQTTRPLTSGLMVRPVVQITKCQSASSLPGVSVKESGGAFRDEDDINDVASMAGVSVSEERARILATGAESVGLVIRSCRDEPFLCPAALRSRITHTALSGGVTGLEGDVVGLVSDATEERLRELLGKLTVTAQHRHMQLKECWQYQQVSDVRGQLRFLEQVETLQQQRKEEEEREILLRIAKSRSGNAELQCLKQKAKEMQQLELAQAQHRQANLAALAAIGPRRKRPLEGTSLLGLRSVPRPVTRVTLRDLIFCMEQDAHLSRSLLLYSAMMK